jgi:hypothetical protein
MVRLRLSLILAISSAASTGCESASTPEPTFTVRDSAGIEIVESTAPLLGPDAWTISEEPVLQIGEVEGEDPYLFGDLLSGGWNWGKTFRWLENQIVVCDDLDKTIRIFDETGSFLKQTGGEGQGPSEFQSIWACTRTKTGFAVFGWPGKVAWFDTDGDLVRTIRATDAASDISEVRGVFEDGSSLVTTSTSDASDLGAGVHTTTRQLLVLSPDADSVQAELTVNAFSYASNGGNGSNQIFGPRGQFLAAGNDLIYGWPASYEIGFFDQTGRPLRKVRRSWEPLPVTEEDKSAWASLLLEVDALQGRELTPARRRSREVQIARQIHPEYHAVFDRLLVDQTGHLWVRHQHPRMEYYSRRHIVNFPYGLSWDVFEPSGRWVTTVTVPGSIDIHDIGEDYILGVWKDELEIEYVRMYSLDRGG